MKKVLVFGILSLLTIPLSVDASQTNTERSITPQTGIERPQRPHCPHSEVKQRLNLSEEQKEQARVYV